MHVISAGCSLGWQRYSTLMPQRSELSQDSSTMTSQSTACRAINQAHATRAFSLKLRRTTRGLGLRPASYDEEFETSNILLTANHVDDTNMAGTEDTID
eukprot:5432416-Pyramimonas_sp.AAC.1